MADRFTPPTMDWESPGDLYKRFKLFKQKCELIFDGPLDKSSEGKKVRLLLLWIGDKGLEIYNTTAWSNDDDKFKLKPVFDLLEAYTKPKSNHILARFQLRSLKQNDMSLEAFVTKAKGLIDEGGYHPNFKDETLRDTLVFGLNSDKVRKDAIALGNKLTFQQIYDLAKTEESTAAQMKAITASSSEIRIKETHSVRSDTAQHPAPQGAHKHLKTPQESQTPRKFKFKYNGCFRCGGKHDRQAPCPALKATCRFCKKKGHFLKVCMKKNVKQVNEIVRDPNYKGQDIHLQPDQGEEFDAYNYPCEDEDSSSDTEPITVIIGSVSTENTVHSLNSHQYRIYKDVQLNHKCSLKMKIDTGADTCILTTDDLQLLPISIDLQPTDSVLKGYGGSKIENLGITTLKVTYGNKTVETQFNIVEAPGNPSMIGCKQAQDLGIITVHSLNELHTTPPSRAQQAANRGELSQSIVQDDFKDCFDKVGRFPGEKYHIQLVDNPNPVIHPPRTVAVHILPLYKAELDKMIKDDIITEVTEPTEWVNSIVCNISKTKDGKQKVRLCLDPKDLNKNIRREHYYTRTIDEILPQLHGKEYFSVADTSKGYWHVELDDESSLLCTFNTPFGRYRFKRLPFGVCVSQDIFQRKLDDVYRNIPNVTNIADDIIIAGSTQQEHDQAFLNMLEATRENNVSLNSTKLQFKKKSVQFYGHTITSEGIKPASDKLEAIRNIQTPTDAKDLLAILGMVTYSRADKGIFFSKLFTFRVKAPNFQKIKFILYLNF